MVNGKFMSQGSVYSKNSRHAQVKDDKVVIMTRGPALEGKILQGR